MYQTIESFVSEYEHERTLTLNLLTALTDASLSKEVAPGYRTLGSLAWHLVPSGGILSPTGLRFETTAEQNAPASASEIALAYEKTSQSLIDAVKKQWTDAALQESATIYGQEWTKGFTLAVFLKHEIHHRGQLTILMRQAGLPVSGVYGPTKEEWAAMGMDSPG
ncbi:DinB family protein [Halobacillus salinarum]|uniref:DinB family protein n=1 Tax=Halobacillus salinarum TaxID=2932257 RepID=A0ABY4EKQ7_9BACI|nr:DinB family protein [Halobacillus salinarum]UOQ44219.1 DinB family protein [Halobacillus salinarum]